MRRAGRRARLRGRVVRRADVSHRPRAVSHAVVPDGALRAQALERGPGAAVRGGGHGAADAALAEIRTVLGAPFPQVGMASISLYRRMQLAPSMKHWSSFFLRMRMQGRRVRTVCANETLDVCVRRTAV